MENKKNSKVILDNYSNILIQLALVLSLFVYYVVIEKKLYRQYEVLQGISMYHGLIEYGLFSIIEDVPVFPGCTEKKRIKIML